MMFYNSYIYCLLLIDYQPNREPPISCTNKPVTPKKLSDTMIKVYPSPRRLQTDEISHIVNDFKTAARNAIEAGTFYFLKFLLKS